MRNIHISLSSGDMFEVDLEDNGGGSCSSSLHCDDPDDVIAKFNDDEEDYCTYENGVDVIESLVLAHACAGVDVLSEPYRKGLQTAVDALQNHMD